MKDGWIARPLANFVTAKPGNNKIIKGNESDRPDAALVQGFSASGPDVWVKAADYDQNGVVISAVGARCGKTFLAQGKWTAIANTHVLLPGPEIDHRWLWYRTNDETFWSRGGTAQPFVKVKETLLRTCEIPPLVEQRRIVAILDEAFEGIAVAKANAERNRRNAPALFDTQLENVLNWSAQGCPERPLSDLYEVGSSRRVLKSQWSASGVPFYRGREITRLASDGFVDNELFIAESLYDELAGQSGVPKPGDIVITAIGTIGNAYVVRQDDRFYFKDASVLWMKLRSDVSSRFIELWLRSSLFREQLDHGNGATVDTLTIQKLRSMTVRVPNRDIQDRVVVQFDEFAAECEELRRLQVRKLAALDELKQSLLHQAFSGAL